MSEYKSEFNQRSRVNLREVYGTHPKNPVEEPTPDTDYTQDDFDSAPAESYPDSDYAQNDYEQDYYEPTPAEPFPNSGYVQEGYTQEYYNPAPAEPYPNNTEDISVSLFETGVFPAAPPTQPVPGTIPVNQQQPTSGDGLTAAEQEDIKRERAARRRKRAERERRRKERRRQAIIRCSIFLILVILVIIGIIKMISGIWNLFTNDRPSKKNTEKTTESTQAPTTEEIRAKIDDAILAKELPADKEAALAMLQTQAETDPELQNICDNAAIYPEKVLQCLAVNPEMKQFVIDYPAKINIVFDGEFSLDVPTGEVPLYLQYDEQWGYADYGNSIIAINGCAPTCLSMAHTWLKKDGTMNPIKVADFSMANGYLDENGDTSWSLMTDGARTLGLTSEELALDKENMIQALKEGKVIICSMTSGDFTKSGHFILIKDYRNGLFYVNDPNSTARSEVGWDYPRLSTQISNMWALGVGTDTGTTDTGTDSPDTAPTGDDTGSPDTDTPDSPGDGAE